MKYYSATKMKEILLFATIRMDFDTLKSEKDKYCIISCMQNIQKKDRKPQAHRHREQIGVCHNLGVGKLHLGGVKGANSQL